jgi:hypothetical protein
LNTRNPEPEARESLNTRNNSYRNHSRNILKP